MKTLSRAAILGQPALALLSLTVASPDALALPSFARQTGMSCESCHTVFPQLTPFGRQFKLQGYTLTNDTKGQTPKLQEDYFPPLSVMLQTSYTSLGKRQPGTQNGNAQLPDQLSLFYAGRIAEHMGGFVQATYDGTEDSFGMDNIDLRFANDTQLGGHDLAYGASLNNNPTVQDLWNSTPAWGFPFASSPVAPTPAAATRIDGTLGQDVAGLGAYGMLDHWLYGELSFYRSSHLGNAPSDGSNPTIKGAAPYWRLALEHGWGPHNLELGTYGMDMDVYPDSVSGASDHFLDTALDAQYQYLSGKNTLDLRSTYIHEKQNWDASHPAVAGNASDTLQTFRLDGTYFYDRRYGGTLGYFNTWGDADAGLYTDPTDPVNSSASGSPDSSGVIAALDYMPWLNTRFALQYTHYAKFNGAGSDYNGLGRSASDNDTLYLDAWLMW